MMIGYASFLTRSYSKEPTTFPEFATYRCGEEVDPKIYTGFFPTGMLASTVSVVVLITETVLEAPLATYITDFGWATTYRLNKVRKRLSSLRLTPSPSRRNISATWIG
jgi:hypothetical protein